MRTSFILGNLTSRNDIARIRYANENHSIDTLINLLKLYLDLDIKVRNKCFFLSLKKSVSIFDNIFIFYAQTGDLFQNAANNFASETTEAELNEREPSENEDVMIKVIRVIANLSINEKIGLDISLRGDCLDILLKILGIYYLQSISLILNLSMFEINFIIFQK